MVIVAVFVASKKSTMKALLNVTMSMMTTMTTVLHRDWFHCTLNLLVSRVFFSS